LYNNNNNNDRISVAPYGRNFRGASAVVAGSDTLVATVAVFLLTLYLLFCW